MTLGLLLGTAGCGNRNYMEMYDLPTAGWGKEEAIAFTFRPDTVATTAAGPHRAPTGEGEWIDITIRHDRNFPYADLPLEIKGVTPDKRFWIDTVDFALGEPDENGVLQWAGRKYSNHYDITRRYRSGIRYRHSPDAFLGGGNYAISVRQLTGEEPLRGVLAVGITASGARTPNLR